ncbi:MAG: class I SAM-dependent methyltransferase [Chloroflexi bacterium]|uniref:Class I SAM-dependent methyltransferase n=1 Tax=Candidatus Chlorohelix allophototropha TaxID=3003348 RepID=A0A8T7M8Y8_9CHLR|nr:class I SAM-dependent methyltransferase [Chloroflexota bacterium]WJW68525.1 class I SAM-dependent methyltransferase [Chloroflexota bacterium L227-S17]
MAKPLLLPLRLLRLLVTSLLRLAFQALYYPLAPLYDKIAEIAFLGQWAKWQRAVLPRLVGKQVLDLGCGTGTLYLELLRWGCVTTGVDASAPMLKQAQRKIRAAGKTPALALAKAYKLPFPDETFTSVVCTFPASYIMEPETLLEVVRVLYPGGKLIIVDTAQLHPFNRRARFLLWLYTQVLGYGGRPSDNTGYGRFDLLLREVGLLRRDEMFEDEQGEAHIIVAIKVW